MWGLRCFSHGDSVMARPAETGSRPTGQAPSGLGASRFDPARKEWHLVCITRKGKVSMLSNLDLRTARETYKRLLPGERPEKRVFPDCQKCGEHEWSWGGWCSGGDGDRLEKVEVVGPEGEKLDPWFGVEPRIIDMGHLCKCPPEPKPWDETRTDFWNNPKLWDGIDPVTRLCWQRELASEPIHSNGISGSGPKRRKRNASDICSVQRAEGVAHQSRHSRPHDKSSIARPRQSERTGA